MKQSNFNNDKVKKIILGLVSVRLGIFINNILGHIDINVCFATVIGALTTIISSMILYQLLIKNIEK